MAEVHSPGRRLLAANLRRHEERIDLALAALLICREEYPALVVADYLERLDLLAAGLAVEIDLEGGAEATARSLGRFLGGEQGYEGNHDDYYDPRNSYLSDVMDRRLGLPISLSVLYMEVARRVGVDLLPVAMPGHFLVKLPDAGGDIFLDPFNRGEVTDADGCRRIVESLYGRSMPFRESMLGAATKRQVVSRLLHNLKSVYVDRSDLTRTLRIIELLLIVTPWDLEEVRDRGLIQLRLGRLDAARADLQAFVDHAPPGAARDTARAALARISQP